MYIVYFMYIIHYYYLSRSTQRWMMINDEWWGIRCVQCARLVCDETRVDGFPSLLSSCAFQRLTTLTKTWSYRSGINSTISWTLQWRRSSTSMSFINSLPRKRATKTTTTLRSTVILLRPIIMMAITTKTTTAAVLHRQKGLKNCDGPRNKFILGDLVHNRVLRLCQLVKPPTCPRFADGLHWVQANLRRTWHPSCLCAHDPDRRVRRRWTLPTELPRRPRSFCLLLRLPVRLG